MHVKSGKGYIPIHPKSSEISANTWTHSFQGVRNVLDLFSQRMERLQIEGGQASIPERVNRLENELVHNLQLDFECHLQQGVLVYGLENPGREYLRKTWKPSISAQSTTSHPFSKTADLLDTKGLTTVDRFNNLSWREIPQRGARELGPFGADFRGLCRSCLTDELKQFRERESDSVSLLSSEADRVRTYQESLLAHPQYSLLRTLRQDALELQKKERCEDADKARFRSQTIRACKFGIEYGQSEGRVILFELGGLVTKDAVLKKNVGRKSSSGEQLRSVTNAELRKAFRYDMSDDSMCFYRNAKKTVAPWTQTFTEVQAWLDYLGRRIEKYAKRGFIPKVERLPADASLRETFREVNAQLNAFKMSLV